MKKITAIKVSKLFGMYDFTWELSGGVNILSGGNGSGKSTLLRAISRSLMQRDVDFTHSPLSGIEIENNGGGEISPSDVLMFGRFTADSRYNDRIRYTVSSESFSKFCDQIDELFSASGKQINRSIDLAEELSIEELTFTLHNDKNNSDITIEYGWLSSGEQLIVQLFWQLATTPNAQILLLDEPENSLSIEWQKTFLESILAFCPSLQIIVATHSPALIMRGWTDRITEIEDLCF